jgi:hypothetical protein
VAIKIKTGWEADPLDPACHPGVVVDTTSSYHLFSWRLSSSQAWISPPIIVLVDGNIWLTPMG